MGKYHKSDIIGWREYVALPDLHIAKMKAKIETGRRTTALNAMVDGIREDGDKTWLDFRVIVDKKKSDVVSRPLLGQRDEKDAAGVLRTRYLIKTLMHIGPRRWPIEISVAHREKLAADIVLGRSAIRGHGLLVDTAQSFVLGDPG